MLIQWAVERDLFESRIGEGGLGRKGLRDGWGEGRGARQWRGWGRMVRGRESDDDA